MRPLGPRLRAPLGLVLARPSQPPPARPRAAAAGWQLPNSRCASAASAARPPRSQFLQRRPDQEQAAPAAAAQGGEAAGAPAAAGGGGKQGAQQPQRYGPLDVDLQPKDQLRPLLPTWNPPPTRRPRPEELELSARLRFLLEDRWWAATIREVGEGQVKVGYDGWPSRHDEWVPLDSDRLYLHESHHADYVAPPLPKRYERQSATDAEGNPIVTIRPPRPKVYDPEKERLKRMLRPPLPYNPEKERLKRMLRGQHVPPAEQPQPEEEQQRREAEEERERRERQEREERAALESREKQAAAPPPAPPGGAAAGAEAVEWVEIAGGDGGARSFRHAASGEVCTGPPPSGWVELLADGGARYYWHVGTQTTQWERPR